MWALFGWRKEDVADAREVVDAREVQGPLLEETQPIVGEHREGSDHLRGQHRDRIDSDSMLSIRDVKDDAKAGLASGHPTAPIPVSMLSASSNLAPLAQPPGPCAAQPVAAARGRCTMVLGLGVYALSTLCGTAMSVTAKMAGASGVPVVQITLARGVVVLVFVLPPMVARKCSGGNLWGKATRLLWARGLLGWLSGLTLYAAVQYLPISDATVLSFLSPVWVAVMSPFLIRETPSRVLWVVLPLCILGVILVAQPSFIFAATTAEQLSAAGVAIACTQAVISGTVRMIVRELRKTDAPAVVITYLAACTVVLSGSLCATVPGLWVGIPDVRIAVLLLLTGLFGWGNQITLTWGLRWAPASTCTALSYLSILWAQLASVFLFHEFPGAMQLTGTALIGGCTFLLTLFERRKQGRLAEQQWERQQQQQQEEEGGGREEGSCHDSEAGGQSVAVGGGGGEQGEEEVGLRRPLLA